MINRLISQGYQSGSIGQGGPGDQGGQGSQGGQGGQVVRWPGQTRESPEPLDPALHFLNFKV